MYAREFVTKNANLAIFGSRTVGALKFGFGDLLLFGLFKILMATLNEFSVYFVVSKLLIFATFVLQM